MATLRPRDPRLTNRLELPVDHKQYLEDLWIADPRQERPASGKLARMIVGASLLLRVLLPVMCVALGFHILYPELYPQPVLWLVRLCIWVLSFLGVGLDTLMFAIVVAVSQEYGTLRDFMARPGAVTFATKRTLWEKTLVALQLLLVVLLFKVGWGITAFAYLMSWIAMLLVRQFGKDVTKEAVEKLYEHEQGSSDQTVLC